MCTGRQEIELYNKGRHQKSLLLTANVSQKLTQPSEWISYPVGDLCKCFTKWNLPSAYTLHSNWIPPTDVFQCFPSMFLSSYCGEFRFLPQIHWPVEHFNYGMSSFSKLLRKCNTGTLWRRILLFLFHFFLIWFTKNMFLRWDGFNTVLHNFLQYPAYAI